MGNQTETRDKIPPSIWLYRAVSAASAIALMEILAWLDGEELSRVPFVTSIVLVTSLPRVDAARPAAIIGGHMLACIAGLLALWIFGANEVATVAAVGLATLLMLVSGLMHPPAGINAFLIPAFGLPAIWVLKPVLIGAVLLAGYAELSPRGEEHVWRRLREQPDDERLSD
jgi:CBS-domain-containing membrane protein